MVDSDPQSRQIYSIYDCLDNQSPKQALNLCLKARKKHPNSLLLQALHSLTLIRLGKVTEAESILNGLLLSPPSSLNDNILFPINVCLRDLGRFQDAVVLYEKYFEYNPLNIEAGIQLFLALCRTKEFQKQYQLSLKLYKLSSTASNAKFLYWGITSLLLQHQWDSSDAKRSGIFIRLALKLVEKIRQLGNDSIHSIEELLIVLKVYEESKCNVEAFDVLTSFKKLFTNEDEYLKKLVSLYKATGQWKELFGVVKDLIFNSFDWVYFLLFVESCVHLKLYDSDILAEQSSDQDTEKAAEVESCIDKFKVFCIENSSNRNYSISLCMLEREFGSADSFSQCLLNFYFKMSDKECCLGDVISLLEKATVQQREFFYLRAVEKSSKDFYLKRLIRSMQYKYGIAFDSIENVQSICHISNEELHSQPVSNEELNRDSEQFIFYQILMLLDEFDKDAVKCTTKLNTAFALTKKLLKKCPNNFNFQCIFICIAQYLGLFLVALDEFKKMDVKNIQLDSVLYLLSENAADLGHFDCALDFFQRAFVIYFSNRKEVSEILTFAFKQGSYQKVTEFYEFQWTIENSLQWLMLEGEILGIEPVVSVQQQSDLNNFYTLNESYSEKIILSAEEAEQLIDNRDLQLIEFEPGNRLKFVERMFFKKSVKIAHLHSMIQLLCKKLQDFYVCITENDFEKFFNETLVSEKYANEQMSDGIARNVEIHVSDKKSTAGNITDSVSQYSKSDNGNIELTEKQKTLQKTTEQFSLLLSSINRENMYFFIFSFLLKLIEHLSEFRSIAELLDELECEIKSYRFEFKFENRIHLTHLIICYSYCCICIALIMKSTNLIRNGTLKGNLQSSVDKLLKVGNEFLLKIDSINSFSISFDINNELSQFSSEEIISLKSEYMSYCEKEVEKLKRSFLQLIKQKMQLISSPFAKK